MWNLLPKTSTPFLGCAYVAISAGKSLSGKITIHGVEDVLGSETPLKQPCPVLGAQTSLFIERFDNENEASLTDHSNDLLVDDIESGFVAARISSDGLPESFALKRLTSGPRPSLLS